MRPRYGGRGNLFFPHYMAWCIPASMRPRYGGRGNMSSMRMVTPASTSFNEAAIWRSRKSPGHPIQDSRRTRASMRPRYGGRGNCAIFRTSSKRSVASMRPRYGGRGNARRVKRLDFLLYCFNEAAIWRSRKCYMEHRCITLGHASMRPRYGGRGNSNSKTCKRCLRLASMRPRYGGRGNSGPPPGCL